jgi:ribosome maturation factor RimP
MEAVIPRVRELLEPVVAAAGLELFDLELRAGVLHVYVDRSEGVDLDSISRAATAVSAALDEADPIPGRYTLEVSSPGLERPLRTPEHFRRYVGTTVTVKTKPEVDGERRVTAILDDADDEGFTVGGRRLRYDDVERARTVFEWEAAPKRAASQPRTKKHAKSAPKKKAART